MLFLPVLLSCGLLAAEPTPVRHRLETAPVQRIEAVLTYEVHSPRLAAREWLVVAAAAPELPCQQKTSTVLDPAGRAIMDLSALRRGLLFARLPVRDATSAQNLRIQAKYQATLLSRRLVPLGPEEKPPTVSSLTAAARKIALAATPIYNFDHPDFQKWLEQEKLRRSAEEPDLEFARRVFLHLKKGFTYDHQPKMAREALAVCRAGKSDCGGLSVLYVSVLRANGVPARVLVGRWAKSTEPGKKVGEEPFDQQHAKFEFFATGIGWVPVDLAVALDDKGRDPLRWFGNDPGNFLVMHVDPELTVDTGVFGKQLVPWLQGVAHWTFGAGTSEGSIVKEDWQVKEVK
jgi:hypothetical protein